MALVRTRAAANLAVALVSPRATRATRVTPTAASKFYSEAC